MEIGSEFWEFNGNLNNNNYDFWNIGKDHRFTLSGRTAIYYVLENIAKKQNIKKAYLPSLIILLQSVTATSKSAFNSKSFVAVE